MGCLAMLAVIPPKAGLVVALFGRKPAKYRPLLWFRINNKFSILFMVYELPKRYSSFEYLYLLNANKKAGKVL